MQTCKSISCLASCFMVFFFFVFCPSGRCMELVHMSLVFTFEVPLPESMVDCEHLAMILNRLQPARPQRERERERERESPEATCACLSAASELSLVWHVCAIRVCAPGFCFSVRGWGRQLSQPSSQPARSHTHTLLACLLPLRARWRECTDSVTVTENSLWDQVTIQWALIVDSNNALFYGFI